MDSRIDAAVETGAITAADEAALETALDAIDNALVSSISDGASRLDPSAMKERIDSLIDDQVAAGTLTEEQAATLQSFFEEGAPPALPENMQDMGMQGMDGMPPPPPPRPGESDGSTASTSGDVSVDQLNAIIAFLENLRESMASNSDIYSTSSTSADSSGLIVDSVA